MTSPYDAGPSPRHEDGLDDDADLQPAGEAPAHPVRLSRTALALTIGGLAAAGSAILAWSGMDRKIQPPEFVVDTDNKPVAGEVRNARGDYAGMGAPHADIQDIGAALGLGQGNGGGPAATDPQPDAAAQAREAARKSGLFVSAGGKAESQLDSALSRPAKTDGTSAITDQPPALPAASTGMADAFFPKASTPSALLAGPTPPPGQNVILAGTTIAAALLTGLDSDLPGQIVAQVTEPVFDSLVGRHLLIPQGSRLIGEYDAHIPFGQSRVLLVWTRIILPDGRSLDIDRIPGTDGDGRAGLTGRVDRHWGSLLRSGLLTSLFSLGAELTRGGQNESDIARAIREASGQTLGRAGDKLVGRQIDVAPTIRVRPGARVRLVLTRDLVMETPPQAR